MDNSKYTVGYVLTKSSTLLPQLKKSDIADINRRYGVIENIRYKNKICTKKEIRVLIERLFDIHELLNKPKRTYINYDKEVRVDVIPSAPEAVGTGAAGASGAASSTPGASGAGASGAGAAVGTGASGAGAGASGASGASGAASSTPGASGASGTSASSGKSWSTFIQRYFDISNMNLVSAGVTIVYILYLLEKQVGVNDLLVKRPFDDDADKSITTALLSNAVSIITYMTTYCSLNLPYYFSNKHLKTGTNMALQKGGAAPESCKTININKQLIQILSEFKKFNMSTDDNIIIFNKIWKEIKQYEPELPELPELPVIKGTTNDYIQSQIEELIKKLNENIDDSAKTFLIDKFENIKSIIDDVKQHNDAEGAEGGAEGDTDAVAGQSWWRFFGY